VRKTVGNTAMAIDQLAAQLEGLRLELEQVAVKIAQFESVAVVPTDKAKSAAFALSAIAVAVARDAALVCAELDRGCRQKAGKVRGKR
jgi:hypothetical protein